MSNMFMVNDQVVVDYAIDLIADAIESHTEDDMDEDCIFDDPDGSGACDGTGWGAARSIAYAAAKAIREHPDGFLHWMRTVADNHRPTITVLCGSTRFYDEFRRQDLRLTLAGHIVLSIGCDTKSDGDLDLATAGDATLAEVKARLDELHMRKIDLADEVFVLDVNGYIGESTRREIDYAASLGRPIRYLSESVPRREMDSTAGVDRLAAAQKAIQAGVVSWLAAQKRTGKWVHQDADQHKCQLPSAIGVDVSINDAWQCSNCAVIWIVREDYREGRRYWLQATEYQLQRLAERDR